MKESIVDPLFVSGSLFQIILNNSSGFFAGSYRIAAIFKMVAAMFDILQYVPFIVGLPETRGGVDASFVIYVGVIAIQGWQAVTLPRALPYDANEDQE
ncbi:hypothetical protein GYMLUDRAFT_177085 [Collybiopsis luxurians FD-317 M1]|uniref:Uncharacterized protein n=1 Tax=Collybiopsis luxurians FD-317 M1 TaxID=944289 RepID=A0A0D0CHT5_9AGAR|nr:hypothetical protein GYMLUDRAFT_177085 [Collybiopsis luxurians FD-317 M1]